MPRPIEPYLRELARRLRRSMTTSERMLWSRLKGKQMLGVDFHRQRPLDRYIVDFYAPDIGLVMEIDGFSHDTPERSRADSERQQRIESWGVTVLRFEDSEVKREMVTVLNSIEAWILTYYPEMGG